LVVSKIYIEKVGIFTERRIVLFRSHNDIASSIPIRVKRDNLRIGIVEVRANVSNSLKIAGLPSPQSNHRGETGEPAVAFSVRDTRRLILVRGEVS
jgi:hypothetical protein